MVSIINHLFPVTLAAAALAAWPVQFAQAQIVAPAGPSYADLADLADSSALVVHATVRSLSRVKDERAPGLGVGQGRFYVQAKTRGLLIGNQGIGDSLAYLVDLPLDSRGKPPSLKKRDVIVFARPVPGRPGELQLVGRNSQIPYSESALALLRPILAGLVAADAPPRVTGVREIIHVPGNLAGSGETQIFLSTASGAAASITVVHQPGGPPAWGVSFSELVAADGSKPAPDTLEWYRLACFLPDSLSSGVNLSEGATARQQAIADYRMVLGDLGPCGRTRS
jgi:hypothetical protein